ncbi:MAG: Rrf2 family transcriptional regulator [Thermoleophilia bacterium]|nr:Rrf2 family transcriptional regulator [Thermoleophilia bacterium]
MEISRQADYAIRTVMALAENGDGELSQTREIARRQNMPEKYLPTIVRTLARAGLLRTIRGSRGGIALAMPPGDISIRMVVEAIDGPLLLNRCLVRPGECGNGRGEVCSLHVFWEKMVDDIHRDMDSVNFADLRSDVIRLPNRSRSR